MQFSKVAQRKSTLLRFYREVDRSVSSAHTMGNVTTKQKSSSDTERNPPFNGRAATACDGPNKRSGEQTTTQLATKKSPLYSSPQADDRRPSVPFNTNG